MKRFLQLTLVGTASVFAATAYAEAYPAKPITLINPYAAGGPADTLARVIGKELGDSLGQPIVIQNKAGAGASIGASFVAKSAPDGYTLLMGTAAAHSVTPVLTKVNYDGFKDFKFIGMAGSFYNVLVVHPSVRANTLKEFIALAKAGPGKLNFGTTGLGTSTHIGVSMLEQQAGIKLMHVPYKGAAPALNDLVAGQVQVGFANISAVRQFIEAGQLKALAYAAPVRSKALPDLPTFAEAGLPGFESSTWYVVAAPAAVPAAVASRLAKALEAAHKAPEYRRQMQLLGADIIDLSPAQTTDFVADDARRTLNIIKAADIDLK